MHASVLSQMYYYVWVSELYNTVHNKQPLQHIQQIVCVNICNCSCVTKCVLRKQASKRVSVWITVHNFGTALPAFPGIPLKQFVYWFWKHTLTAQTTCAHSHR